MEAISRRPECALIYCLAGVLETVTTNDTFTRRLNRTVLDPQREKQKKKAQRPIHTKMSFRFRILGAFSKLQLFISYRCYYKILQKNFFSIATISEEKNNFAFWRFYTIFILLSKC